MTQKLNKPTELAIQKIVNLLSKDPEKWEQPWQNMSILPHNPISGTKFKGINMISLIFNERYMSSRTDTPIQDPRWCTYKQAEAVGYPVKKGEKSIASVLSYHKEEIVSYKDKDYNLYKKLDRTALFKELILNNASQKQHLFNVLYKHTNSTISMFKTLQLVDNGVEMKGVKYVAVTHHMFNFTQLQNAPEYVKPIKTWNEFESAEKILKNSEVPIKHDRINNAYYSPMFKDIHLPAKELFKTQEGYYGTALHELAHATVDLGVKRPFDVGLYHHDNTIRAKEELVAELAAVFTCAEIELNYDTPNHVSYVKSWLDVVKEEPSVLLDSIKIANEVATFCLNLEHAHTHTNQYVEPVEKATIYLTKSTEGVQLYDNPQLLTKELLPKLKAYCQQTKDSLLLYVPKEDLTGDIFDEKVSTLENSLGFGDVTITKFENIHNARQVLSNLQNMANNKQLTVTDVNNEILSQKSPTQQPQVELEQTKTSGFSR